MRYLAIAENAGIRTSWNLDARRFVARVRKGMLTQRHRPTQKRSGKGRGLDLRSKKDRRPETRKKHAFPEFGYRDVLLMGDVFQMLPASGLVPIVTTTLFQNNSEVFYLKENRRQENKPAYGKILGSIRCAGGGHWEEPGQLLIKGEVAPDVRAFFVERYVAEWGVDEL